jgi:hypothetical protein
MLLYGEADGTPFIADIDKNDGGKLEMIGKDVSGRVYLYDLKSTGPVEWSQFAHDLRHTSWYAAPLLGRAGIPGLSGLILRQNLPNPFNPSTMIQYDLDRIELVTLVIYDVGGRVVRSLVDARQEPGRYEIQWDGRE